MNSRGEWRPQGLTSKIIKSLTEPLKPTTQEYLDKGNDGLLSRHFAIINKNIYFYALKVGVVSVGDKTIILDNGLVQQEIQDQLQRNNLKMRVIAK